MPMQDFFRTIAKVTLVLAENQRCPIRAKGIAHDADTDVMGDPLGGGWGGADSRLLQRDLRFRRRSPEESCIGVSAGAL